MIHMNMFVLVGRLTSWLNVFTHKHLVSTLVCFHCPQYAHYINISPEASLTKSQIVDQDMSFSASLVSIQEDMAQA